MQRGRRKLQHLLAGSRSTGPGSMKHRQFCFSCEQMFPNRMWLEEHSCPAASYICSCGTEFSLYADMLEHSSTHEPGHQVLDHQTIRKRRFEKHREQEEQLKRLESAEQGLWTVPSSKTLAAPSLTMESKSQVPIKSALMPQVPMRSAQISQVPVLPPLSQASLLPNPKPPAIDITNNFADSGAPTVDLWTVYQPVVLVKTVRHFDKKKPYNCGKCGLCFITRRSLTIHHNTHAVDKVFGCLGCGLLLSSKKTVPRYHHCNSPISSLKVRLITARPMSCTKPNQADRTRSHIPYTSDQKSQRLHVTPSKELQLKTPTHLEPKVWKRPTQATSATNGFICRVCHIPFETVQLLQRHKCIRAQEFVEQQALSGKQFNRHRKVISPYPSQINGEKKLGVPASDNVKTNRDVAVGLDRGLGACPVNGNIEMDLEDDCYIVESSPAKPAQMIYQLTSSLPVIKT